MKATDFDQTNPPGNPTGFAISTALDLANLAILYLNHGRFGGAQILMPESVGQMHTPHADLFAAPGRGYALTFWLDRYKGVQRVSHGGAIMTFRCYLELVPAANVGGVWLASRWDIGNPVLDQLVDRILDQLLDLPPATPGAPLVAPRQQHWLSYVGCYWSYTDGTAVVAIVDDRLMLNWNGWQARLRRIGDDRFALQDTDFTVGFASSADNTATHLLIGLPGWSMAFTRADPVYIADPAHWEVYTGSYQLADNLNDQQDQLIVSYSSGRLFFRIDVEGEVDVEGLPISDTAFTTKHGLFEFLPAADRMAPALKLADEYVYLKSSPSQFP